MNSENQKSWLWRRLIVGGELKHFLHFYAVAEESDAYEASLGKAQISRKAPDAAPSYTTLGGGMPPPQASLA